MMRSFQELMARAVGTREKVLAVVAAHDDDVLLSIKEAYAQGLARAVLLGDREKIVRLAAEINMDFSPHRIIHRPDPEEASRLAVSLVREGEADILMKGLLPSPVILKEMLHRERGLRTENILSHIAVFEVPGYDRLFFMSDSGLNIAAHS
ncbi:MAG: phosphate butyryltransferase [Eubacteriales bacterium]|nr:phosphate butyryltransferase [Eubacteriales bacterium]